MNTKLNMEFEILKIRDIPPQTIAFELECSVGMARKYKTGESCLNNYKALKLKKKLDLSPEAFNELYINYKNQRIKKKNQKKEQCHE